MIVQAAAWMETDYRVKNVRYGKSVEFIRTDFGEPLLEGKQIPTDQPNSTGLYKEEVAQLEKIGSKMEIVQEFFKGYDMAELNDKDVTAQFECIRIFRRMIGNIDNYMSFQGCLLVKEFLERQHNFEGLNIGLKPQGAAGLDFDERTVDGKRVIGELKTTYPYLSNDLGANHKGTFLHDFEKLNQNEADMKYFFVTEERAFTIVKLKYSQYLQNIILVLLPQAMIDSEYVVSY